MKNPTEMMGFVSNLSPPQGGLFTFFVFLRDLCG